MKQDITNFTIGIEKIQEVIDFLNLHRGEYEYIKSRLFQCYQLLMPIAMNTNDKDLYLKYAKDYLILGVENTENRESLNNNFCTLIPILINSNQIEEAKEVSELHLKFANNILRPNKFYVDALKYRVFVKKMLNDVIGISTDGPKYLIATEELYGKNSPEYVNAKKEQASAYLGVNDLNG